MKLDKEEHRDILLQLIAKTVFPGEFAETVVELKQSIKAATVDGNETAIPKGRRGRS